MKHDEITEFINQNFSAADRGRRFSDLDSFVVPPYIVKSFFLENQGISNVSSINISEERAIEMDISLYLVRK